MIEGFARLRVPVADEHEAQWLRSLVTPASGGEDADSAVALGMTRIVPSTTARAIEIAFATGDRAAALRLAARRGLEIAEDRVRCRGLEFGFEIGASETGEGRRDAPYGLDHVVVRTGDPEGAVAAYGGRLGLDLRLDRQAPQFGAGMMFFRCGDAVLEVISPHQDAPSPEGDEVWGLALRIRDLEALRERIAQVSTEGLNVGPSREGRKPGTRVASVRGTRTPILLLQPADNQVTAQ